MVLNCGDDTATEVDHEVMKLLHDSYAQAKELLGSHREALDKIAEYLIRKETITGKEFMKIFRAVEKGIEIPQNLDDLVIPEEPKALPEPAETESGKAAEEETTVSAAEETTADETCEAAAETGTEDSAPASAPTDPSFVDNSEA